MRRLVLTSLAIAGLAFSGCEEAPTPEPADTTHPANPNGSGGFDVTDPDRGGGEVTALAPGNLRRLTRGELERSLAYVLGPVELGETGPDVERAGFARVGASEAVIPATTADRLYLAVEVAIDQVLASPTHTEALAGCAAAASPDAACLDSFVRSTGQRAWRRPLTSEETARYVDLHGQCVAELGGAESGVRCVLLGLLASPNFLYRVEVPGADGIYRGYAMATRLSYLLWSAPPDQALLEAAYAGDLDTAEGLQAWAAVMLEDERARDGLGAFVDDWFQLHQLHRLERDILPASSEEVQFALGKDGLLQPWLQWMAHAAGEELRRMVASHVLDDDRDYLDLLLTDKTVLDPSIAAIYDMVPDEEGFPGSIGDPGEEGEGPDRVSTPDSPDSQGFGVAYHAVDSPRRGILGTMALLSMHGKQHETSPTRRGRYVMQRILCLEVGDPPDEIDFCDRPDGVSRRESMEDHHMCAASCAGCHAQMDPIGFAMDGFDTIGLERGIDDWQFPLDKKVSWTKVAAGQVETYEFDSLRTMSETFYGLPEATACVTKQVVRFATGRVEGMAGGVDEATLAALNDSFVAGGRRLKGFLVAFVGTDAFRRAPAVDLNAGPAEATTGAVAQLFTDRCAPCHTSGTALGGLSLDPNGLEARLMAPSAGLPGWALVAPGDPSKSYLWRKLEGTHMEPEVGGAGDRMPPGAKGLVPDELDLVKRWIEGLGEGQ